VFNGTYEENLLIDKPLHITGENKMQTIVDGKGYDDVIAIFSEGVTLSDLTIEHCGRKPWNAAIRIQPDTSWNPESITIEHCRIQNNLNYGVFIDASSKMTSPDIRLNGNTIQYNNYGVYINPGSNHKELYSNTFFGNMYGLYAVESQHDVILWNRFENNGVGIYLKTVRNIDVESNGFIDNDQHCQFLDIKKCNFDANYWDNWIGHYFKINLGIPKLINGIHEPEEPWISQIRFDRHPARYFIQNADFLKNYL
jgi:nitrous oxidase accessory protein NosD